MSAHTYSADWFSIFMDTIPPEQTRREAEFVDAFLPPGARVLDAPCGAGRHARLLAARGHSVVAMDREPAILPGGREPSIAWVCADMRRLPLRAPRLDAIICLWQSFGQFAADENAALLREWQALLAPGGILVLDLYNRAYFAASQGVREFVRGGERVRERKHMAGNRLTVELSYEGRRGSDRFEWQVFSPEELIELATAQGWRLLAACSGFERDSPPAPDRPRVQYVFGAPGDAEAAEDAGVGGRRPEPRRRPRP